MTAKTNTDRQRALRERRERQGIRPLQVYAHDEDREAVKRYAERLLKRRARERDAGAEIGKGVRDE